MSVEAWPSVWLSRMNPAADPETYAVWHCDNPPAEMLERRRYVPALSKEQRERLLKAAHELYELSERHGFQARIDAAQRLAAFLRSLATEGEER